MLQMRARAFCARDSFPDALKGLKVVEEVQDYPAEKEVNPSQEKTQAEPELLPAYTDEQLEENKEQWKRWIVAEKQTPDGIINKILTKYSLTDEQKTKIKEIGA
jgi:hypothetical protein